MTYLDPAGLPDGNALACPDASDLGGPVTIWTDGSCRPNPGPGGWAAILRNGKQRDRIVSGFDPDTTNNRMELTAAAAALEALKRPCRVTVHLDSEYVYLGITARLEGWKAARWRTREGKPVANRLEWERLAAAAAPHEVEWRWVKAHAGDTMNEAVDAAARKARERGMARRG